MHANEVKKMNWVNVKDWSELTKTYRCGTGELIVGKEDVDSFVENVFKDVARKLNISYTELKPILEEENSAFYTIKKRVFIDHSGVPKDDTSLLELEKMLRIPNVESVINNVNQLNVANLLKDFYALSDEERLEFFKRLGVVSVKVEIFY